MEIPYSGKFLHGTYFCISVVLDMESQKYIPQNIIPCTYLYRMIVSLITSRKAS